jgi:hypothetical protein
MLLTIKIILLSLVFLISSGTLFSEWGRRHKVLVLLSAIVATLSTFYLLRAIYDDLHRDMKREIEHTLERQRHPRRPPQKPAPEKSFAQPRSYEEG